LLKRFGLDQPCATVDLSSFVPGSTGEHPAWWIVSVMGRQGSKQVSHIGGAINCGMATVDGCSSILESIGFRR
jgi:hypothetical protein